MPRRGLSARGRLSLPALGLLAIALSGCRAPQPGELAFDEATSQILAGDKEAALGNGAEAEKLAERFNALLHARLEEERAGTATVLLTYCQLRSDRVCFLSRVPGLAGIRGERRDRLIHGAWDAATAATRDLRRRKDRRIGVGLRGSFVYGAVAQGMGSEQPEIGTGWSARREALYDFFAEGSPAAAPTTTPAATKEEKAP